MNRYAVYIGNRVVATRKTERTYVYAAVSSDGAYQWFGRVDLANKFRSKNPEAKLSAVHNLTPEKFKEAERQDALRKGRKKAKELPRACEFWRTLPLNVDTQIKFYLRNIRKYKRIGDLKAAEANADAIRRIIRYRSRY